MIAGLNGVVASSGLGYVVVSLSSGISFRVFTTENVSSAAFVGREINLLTSLIVRENVLDLYGFLTEQELQVFGFLLKVSGVGPKGALSILGMYSPGEISEIVLSSNFELLVKVSGVGKKTAQKIVIELKSKFKKANFDKSDVNLSADNEAIEALVALGYHERKAKEALASVDAATTALPERVREALKYLGKH